MAVLKWMHRVCRRELRAVWLLCALRCAMAGIAVGYALLMQASIDAAVAGDSERFWLACGLFGAALMLKVVLSAATRYLTESASACIDNALRGEISRVILREGRLPGERHTGDVMSVLTSDVTVVRDGLVGIAPEALSMVVRAAAALVLLWIMAPVLAVFFVVAGLVCVAASGGMRAWLKRLHTESQQAEAGMRSYLQEALESLVVIRSFGAQGKIGGTLSQLMDGHRGARLRLAVGKTASGTAMNLAMQLSYLLGFAWGCYGILVGTVSYGTLMAVVQLVGQVRAPFASFSGLFPRYTAMVASCERLMALEPRDAAEVEPVAGRAFAGLEFKGVCYGYAGANAPVLDAFDMRVNAGESVAITGPSGIGKSTVLMLAMGADAPDAGQIRVRFRDGSSASAESLGAGVFAYVPQGNMLMSGSVRDVVSLGCEGRASDAEVRAAARAAQALDFVEALPNGFDTVLGEHGAGLSEGQMQRIAVARAVCCGASVLLLDEATSALDEATERRMLAALRELGRTVVIVTHRSAVLDYCDRAVSLAPGA